ncbi:hypothetical protein [Alloacidobacterium sp.]|uniref:hypothetical protein n=1 Tax=Alloacidobacterium sp. TaxID=2951999 RepID=UPI002D2AE743|nr:hypothetical protein [Alloacidobacterium sp.]HYK34952.1 hypothetical protein [Alloacidobacterium sp.]
MMIIVHRMMCSRCFLSLVLLAASCVGESSAFEHGPPPAKDAATYPAVDIHQTEHVAIAAVPWNTEEKIKMFRVDYLEHQFLPIRIIITNSGDRPISLNDVRINFVSAHGDRIPAAEADDIERRISLRDKEGENIPVGPIHIHTKPKTPNGKVEEDFEEFEYAALVVEPHTTRAGFLFYDIQGLGSSPLRGAKLLLREVKDADGKELFYFEIPFDKYLQTQPQ